MNHRPLVLLATTAFLLAARSTNAEDWPWFLGPRHDGTSSEQNVLLKWPEAGPEVIWKESVGTGYSAPSTLGDRLVIHHRQGEQEVISCRDVKNR